MKLSVIVPIYNERLYLAEIFRRICSAPLEESPSKNARISGIEIIAVDDGSTDGSREFLIALQSNFGTVFEKDIRTPCEYRLILQPENQGKGAAVRAGITSSQGDIVLIQDADLEYNPKDYPHLLAPILDNEADAVFGSRFLGSSKKVLYFWHSVVNHFLTTVFNVCCDTTLTDMEACYKVIRGNLARSLRLTSNRFGIEPELSARLAKAKVRLYEVGITYNGRTYSEGKKIGPKDGIAALFHIFRFSLFGGSPFLPGMPQTLNALLEASDSFYLKPLRALFKEFEVTGRDRNILEIGSGIGAITRQLLNSGSVTASDIDADSVSRLKNRFDFIDGFSAVQWDASLPLTDPGTPPEILANKFDLVVAINVVEHLADPEAALKNWSQLLNPSGLMVILVPFSQKLYTPVDEAVGHYKRYSRSDVLSLFQRTGGQLMNQSFLNPLGVFGWYINGKVLKNSTLPAGQIKVYQWIKPVMKPLELLLQKFFGLSILATGRWDTDSLKEERV